MTNHPNRSTDVNRIRGRLVDGQLYPEGAMAALEHLGFGSRKAAAYVRSWTDKKPLRSPLTFYKVELLYRDERDLITTRTVYGGTDKTTAHERARKAAGADAEYTLIRGMAGSTPAYRGDVGTAWIEVHEPADSDWDTANP